MVPASSKEFLEIQANNKVWIHSETRTPHDNNIQIVKIICPENENDISSVINVIVYLWQKKLIIMKTTKPIMVIC